MFFDIGWPELMLIGTVALVVIGPKDLPRALRVAGYWVRKARNMSREFQNSIDQMIREAELDEMRQELKKASEFNIENEFQKTVDPTGELAQSIKPPDTPDFFNESPEATSLTPPVEGSAAVAELPPPENDEQLPLPLPEMPEEQVSEAHMTESHKPEGQVNEATPVPAAAAEPPKH
jgi:sec-independent protein translocase protein TatB